MLLGGAESIFITLAMPNNLGTRRRLALRDKAITAVWISDKEVRRRLFATSLSTFGLGSTPGDHVPDGRRRGPSVRARGCDQPARRNSVPYDVWCGRFELLNQAASMAGPNTADAKITRGRPQFRAAPTGERRLSLKQKRFVQAFIGDAGENATRAAISAGYGISGARVTGSRLLAHPNISAAIAAARVNVAQSQAITVASLVADLREVLADARRRGQSSAAVQALKEISILCGLRIERSERLQRSVADMSDAELLEIARGTSNELELETGEVAWSTQRPIVGRK
jgi:phage terminase small subunit